MKKRPVLRLKKSKSVKKAVPLSVQQSKELSGILARNSEVWRDYLPLRVGVIEEVYALLQKEEVVFSKSVVHKCLRWHTRSKRYKKNIVAEADRHCLVGDVSGVVLASEIDD